MKVKILGTGSIYSKSNCASVILNDNILVDIGPGTVKQLLKENYDLKQIDNILITHLHSDHILDFPSFIVNIEVLKIKHKISIFSPKGTKEKLLSLLELVYGDYFKDFINNHVVFIEIYDNQLIDIDGNAVIVKNVNHPDIESYGFIINSQLGITGDTAMCNNVYNIFEEAQTIICDCSLIMGDNYHMGIDNIQTLMKTYDTKIIIPTHYRDNTRDKLRSLGFNNVIICEDGYQFNLDSK